MLSNPVSPPPFTTTVIAVSPNPTAFMLHGSSLHNTEQPSRYIRTRIHPPAGASIRIIPASELSVATDKPRPYPLKNTTPSTSPTTLSFLALPISPFLAPHSTATRKRPIWTFGPESFDNGVHRWVGRGEYITVWVVRFQIPENVGEGANGSGHYAMGHGAGIWV